MSIIYLIYLYVFLFGMIVGSFLNVCIYRIPKKESVIYPPSHCPKCEYKIKWYDNIPIVSYFILLRGKCRGCGEKIALRYPLVELLTGILVLAVFWKYGMSIDSLKFIILTFILVVLSFIDIDHFWLPDKITLPTIVLGLLFSLFADNRITALTESAIGACLFAVPLLTLYLIGEYILKKDIMGFGDVKLAAAIGAFLGYTVFVKLYWFYMLAFIMGSVVGIILIATKVKTRKDLIPFGPYLAISGYIMIVFGDNLVEFFSTVIR